MPNYYSVSVEMEKSVTYSGEIWIETNAGEEHMKKDFQQLEETIKDKLEALEDDDYFWQEEDSDTHMRITTTNPLKRTEIPDDVECIEWESPSLANLVVDYEKEIAEKDKEIAELKKQLKGK